MAFPTDDSLIEYSVGEIDDTESGTKKTIYCMDAAIVFLARQMCSSNIKKLVALENDDIREKCGLRFTFDLSFIGDKTYWKKVNISEKSVAGSSIVKKDNAEDTIAGQCYFDKLHARPHMAGTCAV